VPLVDAEGLGAVDGQALPCVGAATRASGRSRHLTVGRRTGCLPAHGLKESSPASRTCWSKIISVRLR
jgi:hypothetical protein